MMVKTETQVMIVMMINCCENDNQPYHSHTRNSNDRNNNDKDIDD